jgi:hypothetical protein
VEVAVSLFSLLIIFVNYCNIVKKCFRNVINTALF